MSEFSVFVCCHARCNEPTAVDGQGRRHPHCRTHGLAYLLPRIAELTDRAEALEAIPVPGQLTLEAS